jgi:hypothetical protein
MCTEQGFLNRYNWMQQMDSHHQQQAQQQQEQARDSRKGVVPLCSGHVVAFKTATTFVDHLWELLAPFLSGADMLLVPEDDTAAAAAEGCPAAASAAAAAVPLVRAAAGAFGGQLLLQPARLINLLVAARVTHLVSLPACQAPTPAGVVMLLWQLS